MPAPTAPATTPDVPTNTDASTKPLASSETGLVEVAEREKAEETRKPYRLMVKRRLLKRYGEELSTDAPTRKRQLDDFYREVDGVLLSLGAKLREEDGAAREEVLVIEQR